MQPETKYFTINIEDAAIWNSYIFKADAYDFYHTNAYHKIEVNLTPFLFVFEAGDDFIAIPLLKRPIKGTPYFDCTSIYGYTGMVSNINFETIPPPLIMAFKGAFLQFLKEQNMVTVFTRLHPIINKQFNLDGAFDVYKIGQTIAINLQIPLQEQRLKYRRAYKQKINQARNKGYHIKIADNDQEIKQFVEIYQQGMKKVGASADYFFNDDYFFNLLNALDFKCLLLLAYHGQNLAAGALLTMADHIMQVHLTGTHQDYANDSPMKLLFDEASLIARENNLKYMHIGSGVGGAEDSLYHFKTGFSDLFFDFNSLRIIADPEVYNQLSANKENAHPEGKNLFPAYRF